MQNICTLAAVITDQHESLGRGKRGLLTLGGIDAAACSNMHGHNLVAIEAGR